MDYNDYVKEERPDRMELEEHLPVEFVEENPDYVELEEHLPVEFVKEEPDHVELEERLPVEFVNVKNEEPDVEVCLFKLYHSVYQPGNSGKPGNLREFHLLRENQGNLREFENLLWKNNAGALS